MHFSVTTNILKFSNTGYGSEIFKILFGGCPKSQNPSIFKTWLTGYEKGLHAYPDSRAQICRGKHIFEIYVEIVKKTHKNLDNYFFELSKTDNNVFFLFFDFVVHFCIASLSGLSFCVCSTSYCFINRHDTQNGFDVVSKIVPSSKL